MSITKISPDVVDFDSGLVVSPTLTIGDATAEDTKIVFDGNAQDYYIGLDDSDDDLIIGLGSTVGTTPAIVIDTSANFMVGTTDSDNQNNSAGSAADNGLAYGATNGYFNVARYNGTVSYFNRTSSDGVISEFRKDGSSVGSIGTNSGYLVIGSPVGTDAHLLIGNGLVHPATSTGAAKDASIDIGGSSNRFKDLYLSSGVVYGDAGGSGTSSSNTLDSYEEGAWTPDIKINDSTTGITYTARSADYVKIGKLVFVNGDIQLSDKGSSSGSVIISGLPFTVADRTSATSIDGGASLCAHSSGTSNLYTPIGLTGVGAATYINMYYAASSGATMASNLTDSKITDAFSIRFSLTYTAA